MRAPGSPPHDQLRQQTKEEGELIRAGDTIVNPVTGERVTFRENEREWVT